MNNIELKHIVEDALSHEDQLIRGFADAVTKIVAKECVQMCEDYATASVGISQTASILAEAIRKRYDV